MQFFRTVDKKVDILLTGTILTLGSNMILDCTKTIKHSKPYCLYRQIKYHQICVFSTDYISLSQTSLMNHTNFSTLYLFVTIIVKSFISVFRISFKVKHKKKLNIGSISKRTTGVYRYGCDVCCLMK